MSITFDTKEYKQTKIESYKLLQKDLRYWTAQNWEDYCSYLLAEYGDFRKFNLEKFFK